SSPSRSGSRPEADPCSSDVCNDPGSAPGTGRTSRTSGEDLLDPLDSRDERVDVLEVVVDVEGGPRGGGQIESFHQGLGTMVTGANANPLPVGPSILCPLNARKSTSRSCTSIDMWGAAWAASTTQTAPTSWALFAISFTGLIVPRTFEQRATVTIFVRFVRSSSYCSIRNVP